MGEDRFFSKRARTHDKTEVGLPKSGHREHGPSDNIKHAAPEPPASSRASQKQSKKK